MTLAMMTRASLGHSGRVLIPTVRNIDPFHGAEWPHPPGRAICAASGVARCLKCPALRRNALLTGGKIRPQGRCGESGRY